MTQEKTQQRLPEAVEAPRTGGPDALLVTLWDDAEREVSRPQVPLDTNGARAPKHAPRVQFAYD